MYLNIRVEKNSYMLEKLKNILADNINNIVSKNMDQSKELVEFINNNNLHFVIFDRSQPPSFITLFNKSFPHLTKHYENKGLNSNSDFDPLFTTRITFKIDQSILNSNLENKEIVFYIQTTINGSFPFVNTLSLTYISYYYDIVISDKYENLEMLNNYLIEKEKPKNFNSEIYTWQYNQWIKEKRKMYIKSIDDLIGLNDHFNYVVNDIKMYRKNKDELIRLGESNGLNYMLYGPPGTGKSSFVRAIAMHFGIPVYVAKIDLKNINLILIPQNNESDNLEEYYNDDGTFNFKSVSDFKIVLLEDFDRYLELDKNNVAMSAILNALDGIFPSFGIIRFFSANNPSVINKYGALISRLNKTFYFDKLNEKHFEMHLYNAYKNKNIDKEKVSQFLDFIKDKNINMRQLTHFLCRFLGSENPMDDIIKNMNKWIDDMVMFMNAVDTDIVDKTKIDVNNNNEQEEEDSEEDY